MACLLQLPPELSLQVFSYLSLGDKVQLSATCKEYRLHLAPDLFATIHFSNKENIAQSALAAVKAHGKHTTRIEFTLPVEGDYEDEDGFVSPALVHALRPTALAELVAGGADDPLTWEWDDKADGEEAEEAREVRRWPAGEDAIITQRPNLDRGVRYHVYRLDAELVMLRVLYSLL